MQEVSGSTPLSSTKFRGVSSSLLAPFAFRAAHRRQIANIETGRGSSRFSRCGSSQTRSARSGPDANSPDHNRERCSRAGLMDRRCSRSTWSLMSRRCRTRRALQGLGSEWPGVHSRGLRVGKSHPRRMEVARTRPPIQVHAGTPHLENAERGLACDCAS